MAIQSAYLPQELWLNIFSQIPAHHALGINKWFQELFTDSVISHYFWHNQLEKTFPYSTLKKENSFETYKINATVQRNFLNGKYTSECVESIRTFEPCDAFMPLAPPTSQTNCVFADVNLANIVITSWNPKDDCLKTFEIPQEKMGGFHTVERLSVEKVQDNTLFYGVCKSTIDTKLFIINENSITGEIPLGNYAFKPIVFQEQLYIAPSSKKLDVCNPLTGGVIQTLLEFPEENSTHILTYGIDKKRGHLLVLLSNRLVGNFQKMLIKHFSSDFLIPFVEDSLLATKIMTLDLASQQCIAEMEFSEFLEITHAVFSDNFLFLFEHDAISKIEIIGSDYWWCFTYRCHSSIAKSSQKWTFPSFVVRGNYFFSLHGQNDARGNHYTLSVHSALTGEKIKDYELSDTVEQVYAEEDCLCIISAKEKIKIELCDFGGRSLER